MTKNILIDKKFFNFLFFSFCLLFLNACASKQPTLPTFSGQVADLSIYPQNLVPYAEAAEIGKVNQTSFNSSYLDMNIQAEAAQRYLKLFFKPWENQKSYVSAADFSKQLHECDNLTLFSKNNQPLPAATVAFNRDNADEKTFPSLNQPAIIVRNSSVRALPSREGYFKSASIAGQGYPFDLIQYSAIWLGTPVRISHVSKDQNWFYCEAAFVSGWIEKDNLAFVDAAFMQKWQSLSLATSFDNNLVISSAPVATSVGGAAYLRLGTLLPYLGHSLNAQNIQNRLYQNLQNSEKQSTAFKPNYSLTLLLPVRDNQGHAKAVEFMPPSGTVAKFPVRFSALTFAELGNQLMHEAYGWGGLNENHDCSSMLRDLFTSFGIWLPRNSGSQLRAGQSRDISVSVGSNKTATIKDLGIPFRTLLGFPGHVGLFLGVDKGEPILFHDIWGVRILENGREGRLVIGKVVITSLEPGKEHPQTDKSKILKQRIKTLTIIP